MWSVLLTLLVLWLLLIILAAAGGVLLGTIIAVTFGWIVYIKATEVSQEFTMSKVILIAILPILVMIGAIFLITMLAAIGMVGSAQ